MADDDRTTAKRFEIARTVAISGWICTLVVCMALIISNLIWILTYGSEPPVSLKDYATLALGFLFGNGVGLVKEFISSNSDK